ncbi:Coiled-coil-helix-coiled-coil-helix domain-containing protein 6 [Tupaia chinensis]|uniref:Coiled-coil-helix-coiled-coil-helix domain-containing protein 6 n=1 Tax=Tupaia chinensis TaxID=246437 RepID=L8Y1P8_TUPCH|nr:Coiled-coil-helix-coiled-coil-helix domain-containing protein 6 [Tupaia chinensis]
MRGIRGVCDFPAVAVAAVSGTTAPRSVPALRRTLGDWPVARLGSESSAEMYRMSSQQFHEAASKVERAVRPRGVEPVCLGLQAQILRCYRDHLQEVLLCSDLVKAYQHCVSTARKVRVHRAWHRDSALCLFPWESAPLGWNVPRAGRFG